MNQIFEYNSEKNAVLKKERGICFEEIIAAIDQGYLVDIIQHPNKKKYGNQKIYMVNVHDYIYLVPFVESKKGIFLKTIFPSRKLTKHYLGVKNLGDKNDE